MLDAASRNFTDGAPRPSVLVHNAMIQAKIEAEKKRVNYPHNIRKRVTSHPIEYDI